MSNLSNSWTGFRDLILIDKIEECPSIMSFYFKAKDGEKLLKAEAGQFLPFKIKTEDPKYKDVIRTYSLSLIPNEEIYRISVKKVPNGLMSTYLHEQLEVGDIIQAMIPTGLFKLKDISTEKPLVFIAGGIGITPLLSMFYKEAPLRNNIHFIQAVQNSEIQPFEYTISEIARTYGIKSTVFYSRPLESDKKDVDYDELGYVSKEWIKENLDLKSDFYFCGPPPFMNGIETSLLELGINKNSINYESFS